MGASLLLYVLAQAFPTLRCRVQILDEARGFGAFRFPAFLFPFSRHVRSSFGSQPLPDADFTCHTLDSTA